MPEWFETLENRFWLRPDVEGAEDASFVKRALHLRRGQLVLDAPCGAGRMGIHLARTGCAVTSVDLRPQFVTRARRRFRNAGLVGSFAVMDLRDMVFDGVFHGIFSWCGSFGYFSDTENLELLRHYAQALRPGGRLLIDQPHREHLLRNFVPERGGDDFCIRNRWDHRTQRIVSRRIVRGEEDVRNSSSMRLYTFGQMRRLFVQAGLVVERVYGATDGHEFKRSSPSMITVGRRPR